jgi:hypothetical protein
VASLVIAVPSDTCLIAPIPNFNVGADYYIEADVKVTRSDHVILGYAFGSDSAYYKYGLGLSGTRGLWGVFGYLINDAPGKPSSQIDMGTKLWDNNTTFVLGMEVSGGGYNLYLNGEPISSSQFQPDGNRIGVFTCPPRGYTDEVRFDNLVIREWR